jgi:mono/diheme cytochrome c family protein
MKRRSHQTSAAVLVLFASACQSGLPTEIIVDETPPSVPATRVAPLTGGTLLVTDDQLTAVVADPERDRLVVVDLADRSLREIALEPGDQPGRLVEGPPGVVYVALREAGQIVALDLAEGAIRERVAVCDQPRGVAYDGDAETPLLHVACASGELVSLDAASLGERRRLFLEPDLRDVIVRGDELLVTYFRSATVTLLSVDGEVQWSRVPLNGLDGDGSGTWRTPHVAWRTLSSQGSLVMLHQLARVTEIEIDSPEDVDVEGSSASYGGECDEQPVHAAMTLFDEALSPLSIGPAAFSGMHLAIDLAISADGASAVVVDPAANKVKRVDLFANIGGDCMSIDESTDMPVPIGTPIAVASAGNRVFVQTREPAGLHICTGDSCSEVIALGGESRADTGFDLFHNTSGMANPNGLACASCHPEGRDDGHVWTFSGEGQRRTQTLAGTLAGTAPFHWGGNLPTLSFLMDEVSTRRMGGVIQSSARVEALQGWLLALQPLRPAVSPVVEQSQVDQGEALFQDETVGCASCHSGPSFTNNRNEEVGRGAALQVPSLIGIGMRAPYMHDGCAATLMDRFDPACGGDGHGDIAGLDAADLEALVAYMNTL